MTTCGEDFESVSDDEVVVDHHAHDVDHDGFVVLAASDEREPPRSVILEAGTRTLQSASTLLVNRLLDTNPIDMITMNPVSLVAQSLLAAGLHQIQGGPAPTNYDSIICDAEKHLEAGLATFSVAQSGAVLGWIDEARKRIAAPKKPIPVATETKAAELIPKDLTFRALLTNSAKPAVATDVDARLVNLISALQEFQRIPHRLIETPRETVAHRIEARPAIGASTFVASLVDRAYTLAASTRKPDVKRVLLAVGGPGTAKTSGVQRMVAWAGFPTAMLSGEAFRRMYEQQRGNTGPFEVFSEWVAAAVRGFRLDGQPLMMGVVILDDFHTALEAGGPFDRDHSRARDQFLQFLKNCGDATQDSILSVELAPGCVLPLNMCHVHVAITLNRVPDDMYAKVDAAVRSRYVHLGGGYATEADRRDLALNVYVPQITAAIAEHANVPALRLDADATTRAMLAVVNVDVCIFRDKFRGQNGIRGMAELMEKYKQCILQHVVPREPVRPDIFESVHFDAEAAALQIEDYNKKVDAATASLDSQAAQAAEIERIRQAVAQLPVALAERMKAFLVQMDDARAPDTVAAARVQLRAYQARVALPSTAEVGDRLRREFGYLMSTGAEVDRFMPVKRIAESIYLRLAASRKTGACLPNRIIYARPTSAAAEDLSIYSTLGKVLGGLPVTLIHQPAAILEHEINPASYQVSDRHPALEKIRYRGNGEFKVYATLEDRERIFSLHVFMLGGCAYVVTTRDDDAYLLTPLGASQATEKGHGEKVTITAGNFLPLRCKLGWQSDLTQRLTRRLSVLQRIAADAEKSGKPSADEAIVVLIMNTRVLNALDSWAAEQQDSSQRTVVGLLIAHLQKQLDAPSIAGVPLDLRNLTLFVLDPSEKQTDDLPPGTLTWMVGTAPIEGRIQHGRNYLQDQLATMRDALKTYAEIVESSVVKDMRLTEEEQLVFESLLEFDQAEAKFAKAQDMLDVLPVGTLECAVRAFAEIVNSRLMDTFHLGAKFPDLSTFRAGWTEAYAPYRAQVQDAIDIRERARLAAEEAARKEAEFRVRCEAMRRADPPPIMAIEKIYTSDD